MNKRHSIHLLLAAAALLLATAACTKDELADGDRLPEGQYPVEIARITLGVEGGEAQPWGTPQTRVSENGDGKSSTFDAGDRFAVQIDGEGEVGTYTVRDEGSVEAETPLYWSDRDEAHTVRAWYPATDGTLDLSDQQTDGLAYLLSGTGTGDYQTDVTLSFTHRLAKVRVTPTADALGEVQSLQLYAHTQCTYEKGTVVQGSQEGWIEMKKCEYTENGNAITCWEANVVPGYEITKLRANGTEERTLSSGITPEAGKFYNITLNKDKGYTDDGQGNYTVTSAEGLKAVADIANNGNLGINITLTENINLTDMDWTPIGIDYNHQYTGTFNGGGHTITGLTVNLPNQRYVGLIGYLGSGGTVQDLTMDKGDITGSVYVGGVVGLNDNGTVTGCYATGDVSGTGGGSSLRFVYVGGVAGYNAGTVTGCHATGSVSGTGSIVFVGGVVGLTNFGTVTGSYATGSVSGTGDSSTSSVYVGGVVGDNYAGTVTGCYATGSVSGTVGEYVYVGGVVGWNNLGTVTGCYWSDYAGNGIGSGNGGETTLVDGTDVTWQTAVDAMNTALSGKGWQYELKDGNSLPTLKKLQTVGRDSGPARNEH